MKTVFSSTVFILICLVTVPTVSATPSLFDWAFNIDAEFTESYNSDVMPVLSTFDENGMGTLSWSTSAEGTHSFIAFLDYQFDADMNTYYNEFGAAVGTPSDGQSWEIDEPGWVFGNIFSNVYSGSLDNTNAVPFDMLEDVSFALGWNFSLAQGDTATIVLTIGTEIPTNGFYLSHTDPLSGETIFFSGVLTTDSAAPVPEPATILLLGIGLAGLIGGHQLRQYFL